MILASALMGDFVEEEQSWIGECSSTFVGLISCLIDDAVQFHFSESLEIEGCLRENWVVNNLLGRGYAHK